MSVKEKPRAWWRNYVYFRAGQATALLLSLQAAVEWNANRRLVMRARQLNGLLIVAIQLISTAPLFAQAQQPDVAKLKADAQKVVSIITGDKAKMALYCQIADLGDEIDEEQDRRKAEALSQQVTELEKQLGPEYFALVNDLNNIDPNSPEGREIGSILAPLDASCPD